MQGTLSFLDCACLYLEARTGPILARPCTRDRLTHFLFTFTDSPQRSSGSVSCFGISDLGNRGPVAGQLLATAHSLPLSVLEHVYHKAYSCLAF